MNRHNRTLLVTATLFSTISLACSSASSPVASAPETPSGTGATDAAAPVPAAAFFRGTLARSVADSKTFSDPFFTNVEAEAQAAGDTGHDALLGTTDLGTTLDQFVGLDTWKSDANMDAVYSDPHVLAFGASFYASPPEFKTFYASTFYQWGNTDSGDQATPHYFVAIRGRFADTPGTIQSAHDSILEGAQAKYQAAGGVGHLVYYGRQDPHDALVIDVWTTRANIQAFYSDPQFKAALGSLFDATGPNFGVYGSTDWVTW